MNRRYSILLVWLLQLAFVAGKKKDDEVSTSQTPDANQLLEVIGPWIQADKKDKGEKKETEEEEEDNEEPTEIVNDEPDDIDLPTLQCPLLTDTTCSDAEKSVCVGSSGNAFRLSSNFSAMARIVELLGPIKGASGGSSAAVANFMLETAHMNPFVTVCRDPVSLQETCCDLEMQTTRISFLLKMVEGISELYDISVVGVLAYFLQNDALDELLQFDKETIKSDVLTYLLAALGRGGHASTLVNGDFLTSLLGDLVSNPAVFQARLADSIDKASNFLSSISFLDFVRYSPLDYDGLLEKVDEIASFLAAYAPTKLREFRDLLETCATPDIVLGNRWASDISDQRFSEERTCLEQVQYMYVRYLKERQSGSPRRFDDMVGGVYPNLVITALLVDDAYDDWKRVADDYDANGPTTEPLPVPSFDDLKIGYWGDTETLDLVESELPKKFPNDVKSQKFVSLGSATWFEALIPSMKEPGSRAVIVSEERKLVSIGGFPDEKPTQSLAAMGCDQIIMSTFPGGPGPFARSLYAEIFNLTDSDSDPLLGPLLGFSSTSNSSYDLALEVQTGSVCTDWRAPAEFDWAAITATGYDAPFFSNNQCVLDLGAIPYGADVGDVFSNGCYPREKDE